MDTVTKKEKKKKKKREREKGGDKIIKPERFSLLN
jgi:hypothetical protein